MHQPTNLSPWPIGKPLARIAGGLGLCMLPMLAAALSLAANVPGAIGDTDTSCYQITNELTDLQMRLRAGERDFWARDDTQLAGLAVAVAPLPAVAYLGYAAYEEVQRDIGENFVRARILELRRQSAHQQCYVR